MDLMSVEDNSKVYLDFYINLALQSKQVIDTLVTELITLQSKVNNKQVKIEFSEQLQKSPVFFANLIQPTQDIQKQEYEATEEFHETKSYQDSRTSVAHNQYQIQNSNKSGNNFHSNGVSNSSISEKMIVENTNTIQNNQFWQNPDEVAFEANENKSHQTETVIQYVHDFESVGTE